jgi:hypothetical protein
MSHPSDLNQKILNISYNQLTYYLKSHGWLHEKTVEDIDVFSFDTGEKTCKILIPHNDQSEDYKHALLNILLILQYQQSPALEDLHWQIKKFCLDFCTQEQSYE